MDTFNDIVIRPGVTIGGPGGNGKPGTSFRVIETCNPDGQCFGLVANTTEDRAAAERFRLEEIAKHSVESYLSEIGTGFLNIPKNLAAGVINSVVPGSNLGDSDNWFRTIGEVAGLVVGPTAIIGAVGKIGIVAKAVSAAKQTYESVSLISGIGKAIGGILSSPIVNTIAGQVAGSLLAPPVQGSVTVPAPRTPALSNPFTIDSGTGVKISTPTSSSAKPMEIPTWLLPVVVVAGAFFMVFSLLKPRRK